MLARAAIALIHLYRLTLSPWIGGQCRFEPSCSHYAEQAIGRFGFWRGSCLGLWRILRCQPLCRGGFDPVPEQFSLPPRGTHPHHTPNHSPSTAPDATASEAPPSHRAPSSPQTALDDGPKNVSESWCAAARAEGDGAPTAPDKSGAQQRCALPIVTTTAKSAMLRAVTPPSHKTMPSASPHSLPILRN